MFRFRLHKEKTFFIIAAAFGTLAVVGPVRATDASAPNQNGMSDSERIGTQVSDENAKPILALKSDAVTVNNGDQFNPVSFVTYVNDSNGILPALSIESNVDMENDGNYTVEYKAVGHSGEITRRELQVNVITSEEALEEKNNAEASMTVLGTQRGEGDYHKVYVSANDPEMDLIKAACSQAEGRIAGYAGVLQCVDIAEWYIVNYFHQSPVSGNGKDIVDNLLLQSKSQNADIVEVNTWAPGVLVSYLTGLIEYGHVAFINDVAEDGKTAYVTQGIGLYGAYEEYAPVDFEKEKASSIYMHFCTTRENAIAQGLTIIG